MEIKICDFGLAVQLETFDERRYSNCGTPNYIAPEVINGSDGHSFEVDVWAVGVIIFTLLTGTPPFETANADLTYKKIRDNDYKFP